MSERMMDHMSVHVADLKAMRAFYEKACAPLGMSVVMQVTKEMTGYADMAGFGGHKPFLWLVGTEKTTPPLHMALKAETRAEVDAFYAAAMAAGGQDNGKPGIREHYHPNYYAAFVIDPEGHNLEAVCQKPE